MSDSLKEMLWMAGCTTVMVAVGLVALFGYLRAKRTARPRSSQEANS